MILFQEAESHLDEASNSATVQISSFCFAKNTFEPGDVMTATGDPEHAKPGHFWSDVFAGPLFVWAALPRRGKEL